MSLLPYLKNLNSCFLAPLSMAFDPCHLPFLLHLAHPPSGNLPSSHTELSDLFARIQCLYLCTLLTSRFPRPPHLPMHVLKANSNSPLFTKTFQSPSILKSSQDTTALPSMEALFCLSEYLSHHIVTIFLVICLFSTENLTEENETI